MGGESAGQSTAGPVGNKATTAKFTQASLFGDWRANSPNPLLECRRLLIFPQV